MDSGFSLLSRRDCTCHGSRAWQQLEVAWHAEVFRGPLSRSELDEEGRCSWSGGRSFAGELGNDAEDVGDPDDAADFGEMVPLRRCGRHTVTGARGAVFVIVTEMLRDSARFDMGARLGFAPLEEWGNR